MTIFRTIESELKKVERTYNHLIAYLVNEANYHALTLNEYSHVPEDDRVFNSHVIAYTTNCKAIREYEKASNTIATTTPVVCKHNLNPLIKSLTGQTSILDG